MSKTFEVPAAIREDNGKGASRRLRRTGMVPGIVYGGDRDPAAVQLEHRFLAHALEEEAFYTSILELQIGDGRRQKVILRDLQRHPWKSQIMHVDFQRISESETLRMNIPLHFANEERSPAGKTSGVVINHLMTEVEVMCLPKNLPEYLEIDLSDVDVGSVIHLSDIPLPEGVEIIALAHDEEDAVVVSAQHVGVTETAVEDEEIVEAGEVPLAGEEPEESDDEAGSED